MKIATKTILFSVICLTACSEKAGELTETESGLKYLDLKAGDGTSPQAGQRVSVHYSGWLYDENQPDNKGKEFDSSRKKGRPYGFVIGVGYGEGGMGPIPPNATLVFEVELLDIY